MHLFNTKVDDIITVRDAFFYFANQQMLDLRKQVSIIEGIYVHFFLKKKWGKSKIYANITWKTY